MTAKLHPVFPFHLFPVFVVDFTDTTELLAWPCSEISIHSNNKFKMTSTPNKVKIIPLSDKLTTDGIYGELGLTDGNCNV